MGPQIDKIFLEIGGLPVVVHTWQRFDACPDITEVVMVVRDGMQDALVELAFRYRFKKPYRIVAGGTERQDSVWNGLQALSNSAEIVAIQDAARPCTSPDLIRRCLVAACETGAAVAAQRSTDTIKESDGGVLIAKHLDRSRLWNVQTPQCFRIPIIRKALEAVRASGRMVTDDTAACEFIGQQVQLVESPEPNPKITTRGDIPLLRSLLVVSSSDS